MRGLLQAMEDAGLLTDEFGNALTDLSRFNFKDKIEDPFDRIAKVLEQIRDLLASGIPGALGNLPVLVPHPPNQGGGQQGSQNVPGLAMGGIVTRPTMAMVGEAGPEAIIPLDQMGDGGTTVNVTVVAWDARSVSEWLRTGGADELAYHIVPKIPNAVKRFGL
jgi:hypothetical protein